MNLVDLIAGLSDPRAYPTRPGTVEVRQTHASAVFIADAVVYKVKKAVNLGFLDFSTLDRRHHFCQEEVRLNRRLAPDVYLGVVPICRSGDGLAVEGSGPPVEWAVKMRRLRDEATLFRRLARGEVTTTVAANLGRIVGKFHQTAERGPRAAAYGRFSVVVSNARENFEQAQTHVGPIVSQSVFNRVRDRTEAALAQLRPLIESRAAREMPRDTHGDLHLDHIYLLADQPPGQDLVIIDCIEFNERFRFADPVCDMAFTAMDFAFLGRRDLAVHFCDAYFATTGDADGRALLSYYMAYRAVVRAKVEGMKALEPEVPNEARQESAASARARWLLALGELEPPNRRPALVIVAGLPGSGKSTVARELARLGGFNLIRSDEVRKELAAGRGEGTVSRYSPEWTDRTYQECCSRAERDLCEGRRVAVDATFTRNCHRQKFLALARRLAVPLTMIACATDRTTAVRRLQGRRGDVSDADPDVRDLLANRWEQPGAECQPFWEPLDTTPPAERVVSAALEILAKRGRFGDKPE